MVLVNDGGDTWSGDLEATRRDLGGEVLAKMSLPAVVEPGRPVTVVLSRDVAETADATAELLVVEFAGGRALWFFAEDRDLPLPTAPPQVRAAPAPDGVRLTVTARALLRDVVVQADRLDPSAEVDEQVVTLLPGESYTFTIRTSVAADDPRWGGAPVLRTVNDLRARAVDTVG
ncbi:hypothetical protein ACFQ0D_20360 [Micromonospora zhanjiangensis]